MRTSGGLKVKAIRSKRDVSLPVQHPPLNHPARTPGITGGNPNIKVYFSVGPRTFSNQAMGRFLGSAGATVYCAALRASNADV